jgi:hypothetical protein
MIRLVLTVSLDHSLLDSEVAVQVPRVVSAPPFSDIRQSSLPKELTLGIPEECSGFRPALYINFELNAGAKAHLGGI